MLDHGHREPARTILVVDDESMIVNLIAAMLSEARFTVITALGSPEALKICAERDSPIDLLLTDLVLSPHTFQLASEKERFPHVHGHELASGHSRVSSGARCRSCRNPLALIAFVQGALAGPIPAFTETTAPF